MYKSLLQKINNILKLSEEFEELHKKFIDNSIEENDIPEMMYKITHLLVLIRAEHGSLILLFDKMKTKSLNESTELNDQFIENCYDISTFNSIFNNITSLIDNIDYEFKTLATKYPKYVNLHPTFVILILNEENKDEKLINLMNNLQKELPQNSYKIIFCEDTGKCKVKLNDIINKDIKVEIKKLPSLFIITDNNITEILEQEYNLESLKNLLA